MRPIVCLDVNLFPKRIELACFVHGDGAMLRNLDTVTLERSNPARMIRQEPDAAKIEVEQDLSPDTDFALYASLILQRLQISVVMMDFKLVGAIDLLKRKSERILMEINHSSRPFIGDPLH
jgi:hypothetical protein